MIEATPLPLIKENVTSQDNYYHLDMENNFKIKESASEKYLNLTL
ncbi:MAG: hypothetical protein ACQER9_01295 [Nanobdellota archaeon]